MCVATGMAFLCVYGLVSRAQRVRCAVFVLLLGPYVQGQTILLVDADPCGSATWVEPYTDLQDALDAAAVFAQQGPVEIWVAEGVYKPDRGTGDRFASFDLVNNVALYGGFAGWETTRDQRNVARCETILSGDLGGNDGPEPSGDSTCCSEHDTLGCDDSTCEALVCEEQTVCCLGLPGWETWDGSCAGSARSHCCDLCRPSRCDNSYHVVTTTETDSTVVLDGLTITAGEGNGEWGFYVGAGFYSYLASPTVTNCTFTDNAAVGAAAMYTEGGAPTVSDSLFTANTCYYRHSLSLMIYGNQGSVTNCDFIDNRCGGLLVGYFGYPDDTVSVIGCRFIRNLLGGGLTVQAGVADVRDCLFLHNTRDRHGGGIRNWSYASVRNCAFIGNSAGILGGAVSQNSMGAIGLVNCLFTGNTAAGGGAVLNTYGYVSAINCTFAGNSANRVGGMWAGFGAHIRNCIFWGNRDDDGMGQYSQLDYEWSAVLSGGYNLIQGLEYRWLTYFDVDPLFVNPLGPDGIVGTEDDDLRLTPDSPLIGAGDPAFVPVAEDTDLDGYARLEGCRIDMGAYEAAAEQLPGDYDGNGRVDLSDLAGFQLCTGASITRPDWLDTCLCLFDADESGDIDLHDFAAFHEAFNP